MDEGKILGNLVHLFLQGESRPESQSPAYSGRAEFFTEEISKGNFSLLLRDITPEDKGLYKCVVHTEQESNETTVKIDVGKYPHPLSKYNTALFMF